MDANTSSSADPSTIAATKVSLDRFTSAANDSLALMKTLGLPSAGGGAGTEGSRAKRKELEAAATGTSAGIGGAGGAAGVRKRLGMGRPMVPWGQKSATDWVAGPSAMKKAKKP